jgi:hypothetical protein
MNPDVLPRAGKAADSLALACLAAMVNLPFLFPHHCNPIPSFWSLAPVCPRLNSLLPLAEHYAELAKQLP